MNKLIIMRGVSGSGKTTRANAIVTEFHSSCANGKAIICSADQYFVNEHGQYRFDPKLLPAAHTYCFSRAAAAMELGAELVIIDNTNTRKWEFARYEGMASKFGYTVSHEVVGNVGSADDLRSYAARNTHGLSINDIIKQADRFEV